MTTEQTGSKAGRRATRQRSFRLLDTTLDRLEGRAQELGESQNSVAQRLIEEGLRLDVHPLIQFRRGAAGRRPALVGTRLDVWRVIDSLRANANSLEETAAALEIPEPHVRAAVRYYAEFSNEVDAWAERERETARREEEAWRRAREVLA